LLQEKRNSQRTPLRAGKSSDLIRDRLEEIRERREREVALRLRWSSAQNSEAAFTCVPDGAMPERGLADSGVPLDQQGGGLMRARLEELSELAELLVPAHQLCGLDSNCHRPPKMTQLRPVGKSTRIDPDGVKLADVAGTV